MEGDALMVVIKLLKFNVKLMNVSMGLDYFTPVNYHDRLHCEINAIDVLFAGCIA